MTEPAATGGRRLRIVEIAVLADDREFTDFVHQVSASLAGAARTSGAGTPLPESVTWHDGGDLPREVQAELLAGISRQPNHPGPVPAGQPGWPVHPHDFW